jgi:hypothetical protein
MSQVIRTLSPFPGGTKLPCGQRLYHFLPNHLGHYTTEVEDADVQKILSIGAGYQLYSDDADLARSTMPKPKSLCGVPPRGNGALEEAKRFLCEILAQGPIDVREIQAHAASLRIAKITLRRACQEMHIDAHRIGFGPGGRWRWKLNSK